MQIPWHDEEGVSLVELMVAMLVLGIVMAGVTATMASSLAVTRQSQAVSVAAGLATASMEEALTQSFDEIEDEVTTPEPADAEDVGNRSFTVTRTVQWVSSSDVTGACIGTPGASDTNVLLIDVSVDWVDRTEPQPVSQQTTVAPPVGLYDPNAGTLAVFVGDAQEPQQPVAGVTVSATGPDGPTSEVTDADGCAIFQAVDAGSYDVSLAKANHVDLDQNETPTRVVQVPTGGRVSAEFFYAPRDTIDATVVGREGGLLPITAMTINAANSRDVWTVGDTSNQPATLGVWPDDYQLFVGDCATADPEGVDGDGDRYWDGASRGAFVTSSPGAGNPSVDVTVGSLQLQWGSGWPAGTTYTATARAASACDEGTSTLELGQVTSGTNATFALPWGSWRIELRDGGGNLVVASNDGSLEPQIPGLVPVVVNRPDVCADRLPRVAAVGQNVALVGNDFDVPIPPSQSGDLLLVTAWTWNAGSNTPNGWNKVAEHDFDDSNYDLVMYTKRASGAEDEVTIGSGTDDARLFLGHALVLRDVGTVNDDTKDGEGYLEDGDNDIDDVTVPAADVDTESSLAVLATGGRRIDNSSFLTAETVTPSGFGPPVQQLNVRVGSALTYLVGTYVGTAATPAAGPFNVDWNRDVTAGAGLLVTFDPACTS